MDSGSKKLNNFSVPLLQNTVKVDEYKEMKRRHAKTTIEENLASITLKHKNLAPKTFKIVFVCRPYSLT